MNIEHVEYLCREQDSRAHTVTTADRYYRGEQPLAFLAPEARKALGDRLTRAEANYCRLVTHAIADRLLVTGFTRDSESLSDVWSAWQSSGMATEHRKAILEALIVGRSYLTVWSNDGQTPTVSVDSATELIHETDPLTRQVAVAFKRIVRADGRAYGVVWEPGQVTKLIGPEAPSGVIPSTGWRVIETLPNPLGVVPVVPLVNSHRLLDELGSPQSKPVWSLQDAANKLLSDMLVSSEAYAQPRRWSTGLQIQFDEDGNEINPFSSEPGTVWTSERDDTKFGQFPSADLSAFQTGLDLIIRQIGAVASMPEHLLGIESPDPSSAEQIRAATESLSQSVAEKQRLFSSSFERVAGLIEAVQTGGAVGTGIEVGWSDAEDQTFSQLSDGLTKLYQAKVLPLEVVWERLGMTPQQIQTMKTMNLASRIEGVA